MGVITRCEKTDDGDDEKRTMVGVITLEDIVEYLVPTPEDEGDDFIQMADN
jgi:CBS domain containing-hemolysin-like protein